MRDTNSDRRSIDVTRRQALGVAGTGLLGGALAVVGTGGSLAQSEATGDPRDPGWRPADTSPLSASVSTTDVVRNLSIPWDLAIAGEDAFLTERPGANPQSTSRVYRMATADLVSGQGLGPADLETLLTVGDLANLSSPGEGGALGVAAHPEYPDPRWIFVYYTADEGGLLNRVVRYDLDSGELTTIVDEIPAATIHNGGRLEFGPDGHLWVTTADAQEEYNPPRVEITQDPGNLAGKILRITPEGEPAPANPPIGGGADPRVYTYGHRNPQGLVFTPDGQPIATEHGPSARDEVNVLCPGSNYGWGIVRGGPDDADWGFYGDRDDFAAPLINTGTQVSDDTWNPIDTWAPSGATFYTSETIPEYRNRMLVAGLRGQAIFAISLYPRGTTPPAYSEGVRYDADWFDGRYEVVVHELFYQEWGRLRHVQEGPNGELFVLTSNDQDWTPPGYPLDVDDRIIRLEPA